MNYNGTFKNDVRFIAFLYKKAFEVSRIFWIYLLFSVVSKAMSSLLWVYIPKFIIDELTGEKRMAVAFGYVLLFVISQIMSGAVTHLVEKNICV